MMSDVLAFPPDEHDVLEYINQTNEVQKTKHMILTRAKPVRQKVCNYNQTNFPAQDNPATIERLVFVHHK